MPRQPHRCGDSRGVTVVEPIALPVTRSVACCPLIPLAVNVTLWPGLLAERLHADYPTLPKEAMAAVLACAADLARDTIVPIPAA